MGRGRGNFFSHEHPLAGGIDVTTSFSPTPIEVLLENSEEIELLQATVKPSPEACLTDLQERQA